MTAIVIIIYVEYLVAPSVIDNKVIIRVPFYAMNIIVVVVAVAVGVAVAVAVGVGTGEPLPSPFRLTSTGSALALLAIISFPDFLPSDDGVKTIDTTHSPPAGRLPTQLSDGTNSGSDDSIELISTAVEFGL